MHKKTFFIAFMIFSIIAMYGFVPHPGEVGAVDSMIDASDTISDSDISQPNVTHTLAFTTGTTTPAGGFWQISFPSGFTNVGSGSETCGVEAFQQNLLVASTTGQLVDCVAQGDVEATTTEITITGVTNPGSMNSYVITATLYDNSTSTLERATMAVYILDDVVVSATVNATLTFSVTGTTTGIGINGFLATTTIDTSASGATIPFGTITSAGGQYIAGQDLSVSTNAADGFTVTVEQDHNLWTSAGADIDSVLPVATAVAWASPTSTLGVETSYGHFGVATDDTSPAINPADGEFVGLDGTNPLAIMTHDGASNGTTKNSGWSSIAYSIEISSLQEAGDYENSLTYICTPQY